MANEKQIEHLIDREHPGLEALCEQWKKEKDPEKWNALIEEILKLPATSKLSPELDVTL